MKDYPVSENPTPGNCATIGCHHDPDGRKFCGSCRNRKSRLRDPVRYSYHNIKNRAKQRGKEFTLTLQEFREFCNKEGYIEGKGLTNGCLNVDRIDNTKGYTKDNIRVLEKKENIEKYHKEDKWQSPVEDLPF